MPLDGVIPGALITGLVVAIPTVYTTWLLNSESFDDREDSLQKMLEGQYFANIYATYRVDRVLSQENRGRWYEIQKYIPLKRGLRGTTEITLRSEEMTVEEEIWEKHRFEEFLDESYPVVEHLGSNYILDIGASETKLRIHSIDGAEIVGVVEEVPEWVSFIIEDKSVYDKNQSLQ